MSYTQVIHQMYQVHILIGVFQLSTLAIVFIENNLPQHTYIRVPLQNNIIACLCISILLTRSIFNQESLHLILKIIAKLEQIRNKMNLKQKNIIKLTRQISTRYHGKYHPFFNCKRKMICILLYVLRILITPPPSNHLPRKEVRVSVPYVMVFVTELWIVYTVVVNKKFTKDKDGNIISLLKVLPKTIQFVKVRFQNCIYCKQFVQAIQSMYIWTFDRITHFMVSL